MISMVVVYLVVVVLSVKERLLQEDHAGQHAAQTPHVQTVVVHLETEDHRGKFSSEAEEANDVWSSVPDSPPAARGL